MHDELVKVTRYHRKHAVRVCSAIATATMISGVRG
jgi:hypothetical protein